MITSVWLQSTDISDSYRVISDGVDLTMNKSNGCTATDRLRVNAGVVFGEEGDFAI